MDVKKFITQHPDMSSTIMMDDVITLIHQGMWAETVGPLDKLAEEGHPAALYWLAMRYRHAGRTSGHCSRSEGK